MSEWAGGGTGIRTDTRAFRKCLGRGEDVILLACSSNGGWKST